MGLRVSFQALLSFNNAVLGATSSWNTQLDDLGSRILEFCATDSLQGDGPNQIKTYMLETHTYIMSQFRSYFQELAMMVTNYTNFHFEMDSDYYAILDSFTLTLAHDFNSSYKTELQNNFDAVKVSVGKISDIFTSPALNKEDADADFDELMNKAIGIKTAIAEFDEIENSTNAAEMEQYDFDLYKLINEAKEGKTVSITNYQTGDIEKFDSFKATYEHQEYAEYYEIANEHAYQEGLNNIAAANEYVASVNAKKASGWMNVLEGTVCVIAGVGVIVATWGAATPAVVVIGSTLGVTCTTFGAAEYSEAAQDFYAYNHHDGNAYSYNGIRDTIFGGDEKAYATAENIVTTSADLFAGGTKIATKAAGKYIVFEGGEAVLKNNTDNLAEYMFVSTVEQYTIGKAEEGLISVSVDAISNKLTENGVNVDEFHREMIKKGLGYGASQFDLGFYTGKYF